MPGAKEKHKPGTKGTRMMRENFVKNENGKLEHHADIKSFSDEESV